MELTGQVDYERQRTSSNSESSGRFHTDWLNMMYPRLMLARNLLRRDGLIVVSLDDGEIDNLRKLASEIFGEANYVTTVIWQKKYAPANDAKWLSDNHDYLVLIARSKEVWRPNLLPRTEEANSRYANPDEDVRGPWKPSGLDVKTYSKQYDYSITTPSGRVVDPPPGACWRVSRTRLDELIQDGRIWFGKRGSNVPSIKRFLSEVKDGITPLTIWTYDEVGHSQEATKEVRDLGVMGFDSPKPLRLLQRVVQICSSADSIVLDFFAGSGTTAHSVMIQNAIDGGTRRSISVQLPEELNSGISRQRVASEFCDRIGKPRNVAELSKERLRRAGQKVRDGEYAHLRDTGFRVYKLDRSNIRAWAPAPNDLEGSLLAELDHIEPGRTEQDILSELILRRGLDLCVPIEERTVAGKTVYAVAAGTIFACLDEVISAEDVDALGEGIAIWQETLVPAGETLVVFRDSAFVDDVAKTNLAALLEQRGLGKVRSI